MSLDVRAIAASVHGNHSWSVAAVREFVLGRVIIASVSSVLRRTNPCVTTSRSARCTPIFKGAAGRFLRAYLGGLQGYWYRVLSESSQIRHDGYVVTRAIEVLMQHPIAVPIFSFGNKLGAVMTISGPIGDYTEERVNEYLAVTVALGQTIFQTMGTL